MAYEARREDDLEKMRNDQNNANNVRNAADVAIASGNPYAMAAGGAVKVADKISGGKASETLGKGISKANEITPGGQKLQNASNQLSESGASNAIGKAASMKSEVAAKGVNEPQNQVVHKGGEQNGSLPSYAERKNNPPVVNSTEADVSSTEGRVEKKEDKTTEKKETTSADSLPKESVPSGVNSDNQETESEEKAKGKGALSFLGKMAAQAVVLLLLPVLVLFFAFFIVLSAASGVFGEYEDAFGMSDVAGEETGGVEYNPSSEEQKDFFERVNNIKFEYQSEGKIVDTVKVVAVFHILDNHDANVDYEKISDSAIREVIDSMFLEDEDIYDKETFKENLLNVIIPKYLPKTTQNDRESITDEIFTYISDYYDLIGKEDYDENGIGHGGDICSNESGTCSYEIKGYAVPGKGNVTENLKVSDLYVRLMQCGFSTKNNYGGTFGERLEGETLIPFEKYILGVTYAALGKDAPAEAFKAQAVVARSYILAKHVDSTGSWRTLKEEDGRWILQAASCSVDQVYCDPDKGCSSDSGGQVYSGLDHNGSFKKDPLSNSSPLRSYAAQTEGEVLTNSQGYVISTKYSNTEKQQFVSLAKNGTNYKQILLQVYNQGNRRYGASNITKNTCKNPNDDKNCVSSGEYSKWKQFSGPWVNTPMGNSGSNIRQIGCLATSVAILIAKSGVPTNIPNFNPGTFVEFLNKNGGFAAGGNFIWRSAQKAAPSFQYQGTIRVAGMSQAQKLAKIRELVNTPGVYVVAEVKGNTGQHWVAIDSVNGNTINMMDPGSNSTNMWQQYNWNNTSTLAFFKVS